MAFALASNLTSLSVISLKINRLCRGRQQDLSTDRGSPPSCTSGYLGRSKKQIDWTPQNAVLLPSFLTEAAILHGESDVGKLLNIFARSITEWASDAAPSSEVNEASDNNSVVTIEEEEAKVKPGKEKQASAETAAAETLATIADNCDEVLAFLQAVAVRSP